MYSPLLVKPMREELVAVGFEELTSAADVDRFMSEEGTSLLVINSVCGCAAGTARPGVRLALQNAKVKPDHLGTVFAGNDGEATAQARAAFPDMPPSSPSMALFKDGELVHFVPRHRIESRDLEGVAKDLIDAFDQHCA